MTATVYKSHWSLGDRVLIDRDRTLIGTVIGLAFYPTDRVVVLVGYVHAGVSYEPWLDELRLSVEGG